MSDDGFIEAIESGDVHRAMEALRDRLAAELVAVSGERGVAALAKQLLDCIKAIAGLPAPLSERSFVDELNDRRDARLTSRGEVPVRRSGGRDKERHRRRSGDPKKSS